MLAFKVFYAPQLVPTGTAEARTSYGISVCPSVCPSVCLSRPGGTPSPGEIETPGVLFTKGRTQEILRTPFVRKFYA